jgi:uncharacterized protein (DUF2141 family)
MKMTTRRMKTAALFLSIATLHVAAATLLPLDAAQAQEAAAPATLTLTFQGITQTTGEIRGQLFSSEAAYGGKGQAVIAFAIPVTGASASTVIPDLAPGRYAVKSFHDVDGDGKMGTNPFGMPTEPYAFSNDAKGAFGPAAWAEAAFEVAPGGAAHAITID